MTASHRIGAALMATAMLWTASAGAKDPGDKQSGLSHDIHIMTRVLEASLDRSGPADWRRSRIGASFFEADVKGEYIPTVGAIFRVPVGIALQPDPEDEAPAPEEAAPPENVDLWEKFSDRKRRNDRPHRDWAGKDKEKREEAKRRFKSQMEGTRWDDFGGAVERHIDSWVGHVAEGMRLDWDDGEFLIRRKGPAYSEEAVTKLKDTLVSAIEEYSPRIEGLPANERILVIVEGPLDESRQIRMIPRGGKRDHRGEDKDKKHGGHGDKHRKSREEITRIVRNQEQLRGHDRGHRNRMLLVFKQTRPEDEHRVLVDEIAY